MINPNVIPTGKAKDITDRLRKAPSKLTPKVEPLSIFDKVRNDPKYTQARSIDWFQKKISELGGNSPSAKYDLMKTTKPLQTSRFLLGSLFIFKYDPKFKAELPYYDNWPCSLIFGIENDLVRGINFHYLPVTLRARLFDKLWQVAMVYRNNQQQCKRVTWKLLSNVAKFPEVRVAVKSYLYSHLQSRLLKVDIDDWKTAMLLPIASFAKKSISIVHYDAVKNTKNVIAGKPMVRRKV
jgi:hypothetical protein